MRENTKLNKLKLLSYPKRKIKIYLGLKYFALSCPRKLYVVYNKWPRNVKQVLKEKNTPLSEKEQNLKIHKCKSPLWQIIILFGVYFHWLDENHKSLKMSSDTWNNRVAGIKQ
jgi:hypothetical protein